MEPYLALEQEYARFVGSARAVSCSSGTAALHLALKAVGVGPGDEVILPDFTMAACGFAVSYCGATPIFVDVELDTYGLDPALLEAAITPKTKAIMVVHVYGRLANIDAVLAIAKRRKIPVIEDACEAQGAIYKSKANVTVYSFFKNKIIHAEEGGIVTTDSKKVADRVSFLKNMAFNEKHDYFHGEVGYNYRMPNAEARLALASLKSYPRNVKKRQKIEGWYLRYLERKMPKRDAVWFYEVTVPKKKRDALIRSLKRARYGFKPLSSFPMYGGGCQNRNSAALADSLVLLPASPDLTEAEVRDICEKVNSLS